MCKFFSLISDGKGQIAYLDWTERHKILSGESSLMADSHASVAIIAGWTEDTCNKWEWNPLTGELVLDQKNAETDDGAAVLRKCKKLQWQHIVPALRIKKIVNPLTDFKRRKPSQKDIALLDVWDSVWASVRASVWASVGDSVLASVWASVGASVGASVLDSVWASVGASVGDSVLASVWDSVGASVWASVGDSVRASVWDSVRAYVGSFFVLPKWKHTKHADGIYPFQPAVDLWESGLVASFDGLTWRLHSGPRAKTVYEKGADGGTV